MKRLICFLVTLATIVLCGCEEKAPRIERLIIASEQGCYCDGESNLVVPECFVKGVNDDNWRRIYVNGFDYQRGYEYVVDARLVGVQYPDVPNPIYHYEVDRVVSKEQKESEGIVGVFVIYTEGMTEEEYIEASRELGGW